MSSDLDIAKCFEFAKELTLRAGKRLKCSFEDEKVVYNKDMGYGYMDFVTEYDHKIEKILIDGLSREFPDHKIIAEETIGTGEMPELTDAPTWIIDPIDGTHNFIHLFPHFCISVGLTVRKELALELKKALIMLEPYIWKIGLVEDKNTQIPAMDALVKATHITRCIGSAALHLAYIARGAADCFYLDTHLKAWDVAAGTLILREAGGTVIDTKGGVYDIMKPNTIAASNETLAREISKLIIDTNLKTQRKRLQKT
ncbi:inositol monophosphatase 2-like isoform X2 [Temnothorax nylanderi]|uniref:inositol monophosphatase 2-like isoform X2 n=1 Tax=Temnothorax nylanderi TaxID=102681 RepID=UPI003A85C7E9